MRAPRFPKRAAASASEAERAALIRHLTEVAAPPLVPELPLHLVTAACPLWRAGEAELAALGLEDPFWAFAWPGGQALARFLLDHPERARGRRVLDFGAGSGLVALAAARAGASRVRATDLDPLAVTACRLNAERAGVALDADAEDVLGRVDLDVDLVTLADVTYAADLGARIRAWASALTGRGIEVLASDPGRGFFEPASATELATYAAPGDADLDGTCQVRCRVLRVDA